MRLLLQGCFMLMVVWLAIVPSAAATIEQRRIDTAASPPTVTKLEGNQPNPFNSVTTIEFQLATKETVSFAIYNVAGKQVDDRIIDSCLPPGNYQFVWKANNYSSGVYFYKISAGEYTVTKKMVLLK